MVRSIHGYTVHLSLERFSSTFSSIIDDYWEILENRRRIANLYVSMSTATLAYYWKLLFIYIRFERIVSGLADYWRLRQSLDTDKLSATIKNRTTVCRFTNHCLKNAKGTAIPATMNPITMIIANQWSHIHEIAQGYFGHCY